MGTYISTAEDKKYMHKKSREYKFKCVKCPKNYKNEVSFNKHSKQCRTSVKLARCSDGEKCVHCARVFKHKGWLVRHKSKCNINNTSIEPTVYEDDDESCDLFNFNDSFFNSNTSIDISQLEANTHFTNENLVVNNEFLNKLWFEEVLANKIDAKFSIMHLNINSLFSKFIHIKKVLDTVLFDLIALNETKIDQFISNKDIDHDCYDLIRRDRNRRGGGILVYYKKSCRLIESIID